MRRHPPIRDRRFLVTAGIVAAVTVLVAATPSGGAQRVIPVAGTMSDALVANPVTGEIVIQRGGAAAGQVAVLDPATAQVRTASLGAMPEATGVTASDARSSATSAPPASRT